MDTSSMPHFRQLRTGITYVHFFSLFFEAAPNENIVPS
jgi:hypothetical protein